MNKKDIFSIVLMVLLITNVITIDLQADSISVLTNVILLINILVNVITVYLLNN